MGERNLRQMADRMRRNVLQMTFSTGNNGAHIGAGLSCVEILAALYGGIMRYDASNPRDMNRDRFVMSKGHGAISYYAALCEAGFFSEETLFTFDVNGGSLPGQPVRNLDLGIEVSSGSLGIGLSVAVGMALDAKRQGRSNHVYVLLGDGECNEGSVWESVMSASRYHLDNLVAIVDWNGMQSDGLCDNILSVESYPEMWRSFGWEVGITDGHDPEKIVQPVGSRAGGSPFVLMAKTTKGKGVSFIENQRLWHHGILTQKQYDEALGELERGEG